MTKENIYQQEKVWLLFCTEQGQSHVRNTQFLDFQYSSWEELMVFHKMLLLRRLKVRGCWGGNLSRGTRTCLPPSWVLEPSCHLLHYVWLYSIFITSNLGHRDRKIVRGNQGGQNFLFFWEKVFQGEVGYQLVCKSLPWEFQAKENVLWWYATHCVLPLW